MGWYLCNLLFSIFPPISLFRTHNYNHCTTSMMLCWTLAVALLFLSIQGIPAESSPDPVQSWTPELEGRVPEKRYRKSLFESMKGLFGKRSPAPSVRFVLQYLRDLERKELDNELAGYGYRTSRYITDPRMYGLYAGPAARGLRVM